MTKGMKIIEFRAENFKRLKLVEFKPDSTVQIIGGENAQGKTSVMDAPWAALAGGSASKQITTPIRDGEDQAEVRLDLGDIVVTRTWLRDKPSTLKVESALGAEFKSPQTMLDTLLGRFSFDPLEFMRLDAKKQINALMDIAGLGKSLDALSDKRDELYAKRTEVGREVKRLEGTVASLGEMEKEVEAVSVGVLSEKLASGIALAAKRVTNDERRNAIILEIAKLGEELTALDMWFRDTPFVVVERLRQELEQAEETNNQWRRNKTRLDNARVLKDAQSEHDDIEAAIVDVDSKKEELLANANFPIAGLSFDDDGITFNGIDFAQCSSSEQIRVSLSMAMALNPTVRVIRILDGSLLDDASMGLIFEEATNKDYQVWIERVGNADEMAIIIEDGEVKE